MLSSLSLDNDSFENLIEECRSQISGIFPEWTNYNYSDPGITFLELFVWLRENQQYFLEQLGEDHYREFFRLAGFAPHGRQCARVLAEAVPGSWKGSVPIPAGCRFISGGLPFETTREEFVPDAVIICARQMDKDGRAVFSVGRRQLVYQGAYSFSPFGREPDTGASMLIDVKGRIPANQDFRLAVLLRSNSRRPAMSGVSEELTEISWEYIADGAARPLTVVSDETSGLLYSGRITFRMEGAFLADFDALQIKATLVSGEYDIPPVITGMSLSQIELSQIRNHAFEDGLLLAEGNCFPDQAYEIPQRNFLAESVQIETEDLLSPGKRISWLRTDDFLSCGPEDMRFLPDEHAGTIRFGNGWHGFPPDGKIFLKAVAETAGLAGNIKIGSVFEPDWPMRENIRFSMTKLLSPGRDPETREETMQRIIREKDAVQRAVTLSDYEHLVMETPGLCIHSCHAWTENDDPTTVHIAVRPGDGNRPSVLSEREKNIISSYLEDKRLLGMKLRLCSPGYIRVDITVEAVPSPKYRDASKMLENEIREWFEERKAVYGEPLPYNQLLAKLDASPCIRKLVSLTMQPLSAGIGRSKNRALVPPVNGLFLPGRIEVILNHYQTVQ
ncbi:MAG: baseplate J/gp47 family protein [Lachnospiraceae bacterium]|nr:baseplate J/gp47 family protein [Lachnospiraceae bacterium]